jgi:hypothetical protein
MPSASGNQILEQDSCELDQELLHISTSDDEYRKADIMKIEEKKVFQRKEEGPPVNEFKADSPFSHKLKKHIRFRFPKPSTC